MNTHIVYTQYAYLMICLLESVVKNFFVKDDAIINIASISGKLTELNGNAYSPSKAGVISLSALLAVEWAKYGIRVNALSPGPVMTPLQKKIYSTSDLLNARNRAYP